MKVILILQAHQTQEWIIFRSQYSQRYKGHLMNKQKTEGGGLGLGLGLISEGVAFNSGIPSRQSSNTLRGFMLRKPG